MAEIIVTTTVEIQNGLRRPVLCITRQSDELVADNPRFWSTYVRGSCQDNEQSTSSMLINQYGDKPE